MNESIAVAPTEAFEFTVDWFGSFTERVWKQIMPQLKPRRVLEIGSFEGRSACFLMETVDWTDNFELHCIDTWEGGIEHRRRGVDMPSVEARFDRNTDLARRNSAATIDLVKHKGPSDRHLAALLSGGYGEAFDFVYVDGSHQAPDVLLDAIMGFKLLRTGGVIGFDDYLWAETLPGGKDPLRCPKPAIDAFSNIFFRKLSYIEVPVKQIYFTKAMS